MYHTIYIKIFSIMIPLSWFYLAYGFSDDRCVPWASCFYQLIKIHSEGRFFLKGKYTPWNQWINAKFAVSWHACTFFWKTGFICYYFQSFLCLWLRIEETFLKKKAHVVTKQIDLNCALFKNNNLKYLPLLHRGW